MALSDLRPFQTEALRASKQAFGKGITRQLIALPTGTGKTMMFAHLREHHQIAKRVLVLVHTEELVQQAFKTVRRYCGGVPVGIERAAQESEYGDHIVIGSVPTLGRKAASRLLKLKRETFGLIICDEAHHAIADSYRRIFEHFKLFDEHTDTLLVGVTATPYRRNGDRLRSVFQECVYEMSMRKAIEDGWLCDLKAFRIRSEVSLDSVAGTLLSDFGTVQLEHAVNTPARNELIVRSWFEHAEQRSSIVFCVDIQHAKDLAKAFQREGVRADFVHGSDEQRREKIERHKRGDLRVLTNCGVLIEGYDDPSIACVVLARPTMSQPLFVQMLGRGTRLHSQKRDCIVLDVTDNTKAHRIMTLPVAMGLEPETRVYEKRISSVLSVADQALSPSILSSAARLRITSEYIDLFAPQWKADQIHRLVSLWFKREDGFIRVLPDDGFIRIAWSGSWHVSGTIQGQRLSPFSSDSFAEASGHAEKMFSYLAADLLKRISAEELVAGDKATATDLTMLKEAGLGSHHEDLSRREVLHKFVIAAEKELTAVCISKLPQEVLDPEPCTLPPDELDSKEEENDELDWSFPDEAKNLKWTDSRLRYSSLAWYTTDEGYVCPLPCFDSLRISAHEAGWSLTGMLNGKDIRKVFVESEETGISRFEKMVPREGTELAAATASDHASLQTGQATTLQLALLDNLREVSTEDWALTRSEIHDVIIGLYKGELGTATTSFSRRPQPFVNEELFERYGMRRK